MSERRVKVGIDVGGTFTHAVAIDAEKIELIGKYMVPTSHGAKEGVAKGVVDSLKGLLDKENIEPSEVSLIAHSTTQATNALLEGDVATVGILGMGHGVEGWIAKKQTNLVNIELAPDKYLKTHHRFIDTGKELDKEAVKSAIKGMADAGATVFVVSEAFSVDDPTFELKAAEIARSMGYNVTAASDISQLYGLRIRTRTAVLNASMLPKMLETADMTEKSVKESGITASLMIMRSDGGIMDVNEMRRRPILTMLSGPAAGVAAALMYVKISDGVFLEVGGTSTDISMIKNGRPLVRAAEIGGHRLYIRTLDVRTVGIAGGSMVRVKGTTVSHVGPRSAHIAGLRYASFAEVDELKNPEVSFIEPKDGDPKDYLAITTNGASEPAFTLTTTGAANVLGYVKEYAIAKKESIDSVMAAVSKYLKCTVEELATSILKNASKLVIDVVKQLIREYKIDESLLVLVGGGGGAESVVPFTAGEMKLKHFIAENSEVISAIGAALGMIRDTIERSIVSPTENDILKIRSDAMESVVRMGANPESVEVRVEVDTKQKRLVAYASGTPEMRTRELTAEAKTESDLIKLASESCAVDKSLIKKVGATTVYSIFQADKLTVKFFGLSRTRQYPVRVIDNEGVIRLKLADCTAKSSTASSMFGIVGELVEDLMVFGDAGGLHPDVFVVVGGRILDLSGLPGKDQILSILRVELEHFGSDEPAVALVSKNM